MDPFWESMFIALAAGVLTISTLVIVSIVWDRTRLAIIRRRFRKIERESMNILLKPNGAPANEDVFRNFQEAVCKGRVPVPRNKELQIFGDVVYCPRLHIAIKEIGSDWVWATRGQLVEARRTAEAQREEDERQIKELEKELEKIQPEPRGNKIVKTWYEPHDRRLRVAITGAVPMSQMVMGHTVEDEIGRHVQNVFRRRPLRDKCFRRVDDNWITNSAEQLVQYERRYIEV